MNLCAKMKIKLASNYLILFIITNLFVCPLSLHKIKPIGIQNSGNICFGSSVVQILFRIKLIRSFLLNLDSSAPSNLQPHESNSLFALKSLFHALDSDKNLEIVKDHGGRFLPSQFIAGEPGDSEELYTAYLDIFEKVIGNDLKKEVLIQVIQNRTITTTSTTKSNKSTEFWPSIKVNFPEFYSTQHQPLSLENLFTMPQGPFAEENPSPYLKQIYRISGAGVPKILTISFVRTLFCPSKGEIVKIKVPVLIPEVLNISSLITSDSDVHYSPNFYLKMFILHSGSAERGHYISYVKDDITDTIWYIIDDEKVEIISKEDALNAAKISSLCFYEQHKQ